MGGNGGGNGGHVADNANLKTNICGEHEHSLSTVVVVVWAETNGVVRDDVNVMMINSCNASDGAQ